MNYLVKVTYNPGPSKSYIVENVATHEAARAKVLALIGYDPGVPVAVTECPLNKNVPRNYSNLGGSND